MEQTYTFYPFTIHTKGKVTVSVTPTPNEHMYDITRFDFSWEPDAEEITIEWYTPIIDIGGRFHPDCRHDRSLPAEWMSWQKTMTSYSLPLHVYYNDQGINRYGFAFSETEKELIINSGVHEETGELRHRIVISLPQFGTNRTFTAELLEIRENEPFEDTVRTLSAWLSRDDKIMPVPDAARLPMYSTWYSFHQDMTAKEIEAECEIAKSLGFSTIIVDDGWQTEDNNRGYAFCGEYEVAKKKFPDMKAHVARVHHLGMKYMVWLSVPFLGNKSKVWDRFCDKLLCFDEGSSAGILDPRYPEVREFLIGIYTRMVKDFCLDGLKLDFIDRFHYTGVDFKEGMDEVSVQDAVVRLMTDVRAALQSIQPDIMIEFRQRYIGPNMRAFGNMFRVNDCPNDYLTNRICSVDLRLTSGNTAVHSDMLMWHPAETPESAARQILNVLFSVLQFSVKLTSLPEEHKRMVRFWVKFMKEHQTLLLDAPIYGEAPQLLYPLVRAKTDQEEMIAVYEEKYVATLSEADTHYLVNATHDDGLWIEWEGEESVAHAIAYNTLGETAYEKEWILTHGIQKIEVPESGLLVLS